MLRARTANMLDIAMALSHAVDHVSPELTDHHLRVAYVSMAVAEELAMDQDETNSVVLGAMLHDIGALSLNERRAALDFEFDAPHVHAEVGYRLLQPFEYLSNVANIVRWHHVPWGHGKGVAVGDEEVPQASHVIHLADRMSVLLDPAKDPLGQSGEILATIKAHSAGAFAPAMVDALARVAARESFWLDLSSEKLDGVVTRSAHLGEVLLSLDELTALTRLFSQLVDFRSRFTATHSAGVASVGESLVSLLGFSESECALMKIAGFLHDLGKLAVPAEILEKSGKLTSGEFNVILGHSYYTYRILEQLGGLEDVNHWASFHHERIDGAGYPFKLQGSDLPLGSRAMAVADVFTALTEDRPYREGMLTERSLSILDSMVKEGALDGGVVSALKGNVDQIDGARRAAQTVGEDEYARFYEGASAAESHSQEIEISLSWPTT